MSNDNRSYCGSHRRRWRRVDTPHRRRVLCSSPVSPAQLPVLPAFLIASPPTQGAPFWRRVPAVVTGGEIRKADRGSAEAVGNAKFRYRRPLTDTDCCQPVEEIATSDLTVEPGLITGATYFLRTIGSVFADKSLEAVCFSASGGLVLADLGAPVFDTCVISCARQDGSAGDSNGGASRRQSLAGSVAHTTAGRGSHI